MEEIWKECHITDKYSVSNLGRVRDNFTNKIKKSTLSNCGYNVISMRVNGIKKVFTIHRLMLLTFKSEEWFEGAVVNHKDGNKLNNNLNNLEWCTVKENCLHAYKLKLIKPICGVDNFLSKLTEQQVLEIRKMYNEGYSQVTISKIYNIGQDNISSIVNNKTWQHLYWEPKPVKEKIKINRSGEKSSTSKLTKEQVLEIRRLYPEVNNYTKLGKIFGVSDVNIKKIVLRKSWTHI